MAVSVLDNDTDSDTRTVSGGAAPSHGSLVLYADATARAAPTPTRTAAH